MTQKRFPPNVRRRRLVAAAIAVAKRDGLFKVDMATVGAQENVSRTLVYKYFKSALELQAEVITFAIQKPIPEILQQAVIMKHPTAVKNKDRINTIFKGRGLPCL